MPAGNEMTIKSMLLRVSGRVKENVSPPKLLTYIGVAREDAMTNELSVFGSKFEMEPTWESMELRDASQVVTVN